MSKLIRYCEGLMEAVWLTAIISVPIFLNFHGERIESEKNFLLRSLAIILITAWAIKIGCELASNGGFSKSWRMAGSSLIKVPLAAPLIVLAALLLISTLLSLSPWLSFFGATRRCLGSYSYFCCLAFLGAIVATVRAENQVNRILTVSILTSVPISLYGIGQRFSIEPIPWLEGPDISRVSSTLGNPIYLGAYLIMVLPLTLSRVLIHYSAFRSASNQRAAHLAQSVIYGFTALLQLWATFLTVSRGPFVGLVAGLSTMLLLLAAYARKRWLVTAIIGTGTLVVAGLALLIWSGSLQGNLKGSFAIQRFSEMLNPKIGTGAERAAAWKVAAQASRFPKILATGERRNDSFSVGRCLVGYGPENVGVVSRLYSLSEFNAVLPNNDLFDRFHSDFWDTLITTGVLGLSAYQALTFLVVFYGLKWLGLLATHRQAAIFWGLFLGTGIVASVSLWLWQGVGFVGLGLRFGTSIGLLAFLVWVSLRTDSVSATQRMPMNHALILIALIAGIVAHLIEVSFLFIFETSLLYFWIYVALLLVVGFLLPSAKSNATSRHRASAKLPIAPPASASQKGSVIQRKANRVPSAAQRTLVNSVWFKCWAWRTEILAGLVIGIVWANLGLMLIQKTAADSATKILIDAFIRWHGNNNVSSLVLPAALGSIWLLLSVASTNESKILEPSKPWLRSFLLTMTVSGAMALAYWCLLAAHTVRMIPFRAVTLDSLKEFLSNRLFVVDFHYGFTLLLILLFAIFLAENLTVRPDPPRRWTPFAYFGALVIGIGSITLIYNSNMKWSKVSILEKIANEEYFQRNEQWPITVAIHEAAIKAAPMAENHYLALGQTLMAHAAAANNPAEQAGLFEKADRVLEIGSRLRPLTPAFLILRGNLYLKWSRTENIADKKIPLANKAIEFYQRATVMDPGNYALWNNMAFVELTILGSPDKAHRYLLQSLDLQPNSHSVYGLLGVLFFQKAAAAQRPSEQQLFYRSALTNFQKAVALAGTNAPDEVYRYRVNLGALHVNLGEASRAITHYENALTISPPAERWRNEEILARLYADVKNKTNSLEHLRRAIELAPAVQQPNLIRLKEEILARP